MSTKFLPKAEEKIIVSKLGKSRFLHFSHPFAENKIGTAKEISPRISFTTSYVLILWMHHKGPGGYQFLVSFSGLLQNPILLLLYPLSASLSPPWSPQLRVPFKSP